MLLRFALSFTVIFMSLLGFSQQNSYQGLLWEISGNGLNTPSYLYGTMHVSNKLAFNVSDSFYLCLNRVEGIALESSPADWMEDYRDMGAFSGGNYSYDGFYEKAFDIDEPKNDVTYELMENKNGLMNQILYRFNPGNEDYQENTFLDMFIFQAGAKNNKPIYSLETLEEVIDLSILAMTPDKDKEEDNSRNNYLESDGERKYVLLEEAYRRGDLNQIDSLSKANNPTSVYHDYFIVERNRNMVRRIDSIVSKNSLFIGIGAAHLPGEGGAIELLRELGYNVRAVNPKSSGKSHKMRKKLEGLYRPIDFQPHVTEDKFIKVSVPGTLYQMPTSSRGKMEYLCPEPINGGYFSIVRMSTYGGIFGKNPDYYKATFDSLIYIATPGELIKKEDIMVNGHQGYRILTQTSKNAYVNYNVFFTPTEIIVFKGFGIGEYILKSDPKRFFSEIQLGKNSSEWNDVVPIYGGAKWKMKGMVSGQDMIEGLENTEVEPTYQSFDSENEDYYLVMRYTYNDLDFIEEDSFDLAYLGESFGKKMGYELTSTTFHPESGYSYVLQDLKADEDHQFQTQNLKLKLVTQGGYYYLMTTTAKDANASTFFDSFEFDSFVITDEFEEFIDTNLYYTVETIVEKELPSMPGRGYGYGQNNDDDEDRSYLSSTGSKYHTLAKTGEGIYVGYVKFHDYYGADSISGFWENRTESLTKEHGLRVSRRVEKEIDGDLTLSYMLTDTGSAKGIMTHFRLHNGVQYLIQSLVDTVTGPSPYVQRFFDTFQPKDTLIGRDLFEDKAELFFTHINGEDSLNRVNAIKSINTVDFEEKDVPGVAATYYNYEYEEDTEQEYREDLILSLANIEVEPAYQFLYYVYDSNNFNSDLQFVALRCFSYTETEEAYAAIKKLLLSNPPFSEKESKLKFFDYLYDSLELATDYYPEMYEMAKYADYHPHVMELLADGYLQEIYTFDNFKSEKSVILRNAKIELKRTVTNQNASNTNSYGYGYGRINQYDTYHTLFLDYYTLMCGFQVNGDKDADAFFEDIYRIDDEKFKVEAEIIHAKLGMDVDTSQINEVSRDEKYRAWVFNRLEDEELLEYLDPAITQQDIAFALLYNNGYDEEEDTVAFVKTVTIDNGKEQGTIYFFKRKEENKKNWMIDYVGLMPSDETDFSSYKHQTKKGLSFKTEDQMDETIEHTIEIFELKHRKRVDLDSYDYGGLSDGLF